MACNDGLGLRRMSSLASSAFLASAAGKHRLQDQILHCVSPGKDYVFDHCLQTRVDNGTQPPDDTVTHIQKIRDKIVVDVEYSHLLRCYSEPYHRARLLAVAALHSGDWLHTLPINACGLHLNDNAIRLAVDLRLCCAICEAHSCPAALWWILSASMRCPT